jgi:hypothetical protein
MEKFLDDLAVGPHSPASERSSPSVQTGPRRRNSSIQLSAGQPKSRLKRLQITFEGGEGAHFSERGCIGLHAPNLEVLALDFLYYCDGHPKPHGLTKVLNLCNPTHLRQLCAPLWTINDPMCNFAQINPFTLLLLDAFWEGSQTSRFGQANVTFKKLQKTHKKNTRVRVIAFKLKPFEYKSSGQREYVKPQMEYFIKCEAKVLDRKEEVMLPVSYAELKKAETEIDILEPPPATIGEYGRV